MPLTVNLRHLEKHDVTLDGEMSAADLEIETRDEMVQLRQPLRHSIEVQKLGDSLLVRGRLILTLDCLCVRCLKPFSYRLEMRDWTCHVPLVGEESAPVVSDSVDLTPYLREDILLEFPQHPLCKPGCDGLKNPNTETTKKSGADGIDKSSPWTELDKLKTKS